MPARLAVLGVTMPCAAPARPSAERSLVPTSPSQPPSRTPSAPALQRWTRAWPGARLALALALAAGAPACGSAGDATGSTAGGGKAIGGGNVNTGAAAGATTTTPPTSAAGAAIVDRLAIPQLAALPLFGCVSNVFSGPIQIGGTTFDMLIDSGSTTTAVASRSCSACSSLEPLYDIGRGVNTGHAAQAKYGDNSGWSGTVVTDTMGAQVGSSALTPTVKVNFGAMTQESDFFTASICPGKNDPANGFQGILGLGPDTLLERYTTGWLDAIKSTGALKYDAFAVQLCSLGGQMWFGGFDPNFVTDEPVYTPLVTSGPSSYYYGVQVADLAVSGTSLGLSASDLGDTVVDTGTSGFYVGTRAFQGIVTTVTADANYRANFPASMMNQGNCATSKLGLSPDAIDATLPSLAISFPNANGRGNFTLTMRPTESYLMAVQDSDTNEYAYCAVVSSSTLSIMGASMMREHMVIFDRDEAQVGFAPEVGCSRDVPRLSGVTN